LFHPRPEYEDGGYNSQWLEITTQEKALFPERVSRTDEPIKEQAVLIEPSLKPKEVK
jgi:hypothetical protein